MKFKQSKWSCDYCNYVMHSTYSGQFIQCKCGKSFIDITECYMRKGGSVTEVKEEK